MEEHKLTSVIAVVGPTASGKTELAVDICREFEGEVISADSMQIYKGMDIATAKPLESEKKGITHHLIDILSPSETFSAAEYCKRAADAISGITDRGKIPVLCGGTGLYIESLLENIDFGSHITDVKIRDNLKKRADDEGMEALLQELSEIDRETAGRLHINDRKRILRALEFYEQTGITISEQRRLSRAVPSSYDAFIIYLTFRNRDILYERINTRVDKMLACGLENEAKQFFSEYGSGTAAMAIGYKELRPYLDGICTLDEAAETLKRETRRYAKRQTTWFNHYEKAQKFFIDDYSSYEDFFEEVCRQIREKFPERKEVL